MEDELDKLIICPKCYTLHRKIKLHYGTKALCRKCNSVLYRHHKNLIDNLLALNWVSFIFLVLTYTFSIMRINLNGVYRHLNIILLFEMIFSNQFYLVGFILAFLIFIFPILINFLMIVLLTFMKLKRSPYLVKRLLILVAKLVPWNMLDIFFISILIAMVKLFNYANIELDVAFGTLAVVVLLNIVTFKRVKFGALWDEYIKIYGKEK